ncbi:Heat shock protein DnaJ with tetratricopeptide repeat [Forsythia ovata]|uniref:Heat shock protein DnaJ with tetratricopeptide repeat n=1 Tax=Forsythia ovata TaxID=205694 RepID=A0ABD1VMP1_9LAMI
MQMVERYVRDAKMLIEMEEQRDTVAALRLLEATLAILPRIELTLELKAWCLLSLRRLKEVFDMLSHYIPSLEIGSDDESLTGSSDNSSTQLSREQVNISLEGLG